MRRACSPFEAWGAWQRSRFAARCGNCLKVAGPARDEARGEKNCFVWQVPTCSTAGPNILAVSQVVFHQTDNDEQ
eukprot:scaffold30839_cov27-Phaeocystis_antarctica.AAC.1